MSLEMFWDILSDLQLLSQNDMNVTSVPCHIHQRSQYVSGTPGYMNWFQTPLSPALKLGHPHLGCTCRRIHESFLISVCLVDCRLQHRYTCSWSTYTSIRRSVKEGNPQFQGCCICGLCGLGGGCINSVGLQNWNLGGFIIEGCQQKSVVVH